MYPPGYYLSNQHVTQVLTELKDTLYGNPAEQPETKETSGDSPKSVPTFTRNERYTAEHLQRLLNVYKPYYAPQKTKTFDVNSRRYPADVEEQQLEGPKSWESRGLLSPHVYGIPVQGMPQTMTDHNLSQRLQNLIEGELQPSTVSPVQKSARYLYDDEEIEFRSQKLREHYSLEYVYPLLLAGYSYPYTKWLMLQRELARLERQKVSRTKGHSFDLEPSVMTEERKPAPISHKCLSEPNLDKFHAYNVASSEEFAYDFRAKPWEYMNLLKRKELQRSMEALN